MSRPVDLLYDSLGLITTPQGLQFEIVGVKQDVITGDFKIEDARLNCQEVLDVMQSVKIHLTPLMSEDLYEKLRQIGGEGTELNCDALNDFIATVDESYFEDPTPFMIEQVRDMHIYDLALCAIKEELYHRIATYDPEERQFIVENGEDVPVTLLTLSRPKHGYFNHKRIYMLYYELFKTVFKLTEGGVILFTDIFLQPSYYNAGNAIGPALFWRAFFEALKDSGSKHENLVIMENDYTDPTTIFYSGLSSDNPESPVNEFDAVYKLYDPDASIEIQNAYSNPVDVAYSISDEYENLTTYVVLFGDPEELLGGRVCGKFNERIPIWPTEWFACQGTSSLTSLSFIEYYTVKSKGESVFSKDWEPSVLNIKGERVPVPQFSEKKMVIPKIKREVSEIRSRYLTTISLLRGEYDALREERAELIISQPKNEELKEEYEAMNEELKSLDEGSEEYDALFTKMVEVLNKALKNVGEDVHNKVDTLRSEIHRLRKEIADVEAEEYNLISKTKKEYEERKAAITLKTIPAMVEDIKTRLKNAKEVLEVNKKILEDNPLIVPKKHKKVSFGEREIRIYEKD